MYSNFLEKFFGGVATMQLFSTMMDFNFNAIWLLEFQFWLNLTTLKNQPPVLRGQTFRGWE